MKLKSNIFFLLLVLAFASCDKNIPQGQLIPDSFTKRVLIEEFGGEWCSFCVGGAVRFEELLNKNPEHYIGVSLHYDDPFEIKYPNIVGMLLSKFEIISFPYTIVDRTIDEEKSWEVQSEFRLSKSMDIGIKVKTEIVNNNLDITIDFVSKRDMTDIYLSVYIVENNVPESSPGAQSGGGGQYIHRHVLRKILTKRPGDPLVLIKNKIQTSEFAGIRLGQYDNSNVEVVAFIHRGTSNSFEVLNANRAKVNDVSGW